MFNFFSKIKKYYNGIENEELMNELFNKIYKLNNENTFKSKVILEYFINSIENEEAIQNVFKIVYGGKEKLDRAEEMERILSFETSIKNCQYQHWSNKKIYTVLGIAIPKTGVILEECFDVLHTEDEEIIPIYVYFNHMYHNYNDDVLIIYTDKERLYARPYCMFFGEVEDEGIKKERFKKIVE